MSDPNVFAKLVPGFDFLQGLMKNAGGSVPAMNQWIAPTLDPDELDKRIRDLRTVQFWLEQNAKLIATSIQALEVQRMTLATLKTMNLPLSSLHDAMSMTPQAPAPDRAPAAAPTPPAPQAAPPAPPAAQAEAGTPAAPTVDPMQWWGALTQQFGEIAARTIAEMPGAAAAGQAAARSADAAAAKTAGKADGKAAAKKKKTSPTRKRAAAPKRARGA